MTRLVADLKRVRPDILVVLGGPEVSYESSEEPIVQLSDYVIAGEGDVAFRELCQRLLAGDVGSPKMIQAPVPTFDQIQLPYDFYDETDVANRVIYVEVSRVVHSPVSFVSLRWIYLFVGKRG